MTNLSGKNAVVTGASQGIGKAIAEALHDAGARLALLGRSRERLSSSLAKSCQGASPAPLLIEADLLNPTSIEEAGSTLRDTLPTIDILIHCGGAYRRGSWDEIEPNHFIDLLCTNVVGPYNLTRQLLPKLLETDAHVVFVNSSIIRSEGLGAAHFKCSQHAFHALADSLRSEFGKSGLRVSSVYPGRTATPRQEYIYQDERREYKPDLLLQPIDVASAVLFCLSQPETAELTDIYLRPRIKT